MLYTPSKDIDEDYADGFRAVAASMGLSPHLLGAQIDMRGENADRGEAKRHPDFVYFRGYRRAGGGYGFAIHTSPDASIGRGHPEVSIVGKMWIERLLARPENAHLRKTESIFSNVTDVDFASILTRTSQESTLAVHVSELLAEAAKRLG